MEDKRLTGYKLIENTLILTSVRELNTLFKNNKYLKMINGIANINHSKPRNDVLKNLYRIISDNFNEEPLNTFEDFYNDYIKLNNEFNEYFNFIKIFNKGNVLLDENEENIVKKLYVFVSKLTNFYELAKKINKLIGENLDDANFAIIADKYNKKMSEILTDDFKFILLEENQNIFDDEFIKSFSTLRRLYFTNFTATQEKENKPIPKPEIILAYNKTQISKSEQERLMYIDKANNLYNELCEDFLRDLKQQYSQSSKDLYTYFVDVKFKKFVENFSMPLSKSTSIGKAKEACSQIRNLMDYISKISENSYISTSTSFGKN